MSTVSNTVNEIQKKNQHKTAIDEGQRVITRCKQCKHRLRTHGLDSGCRVKECKCSGWVREQTIMKNKICSKCGANVAFDDKYEKYVCRCGNTL